MEAVLLLASQKLSVHILVSCHLFLYRERNSNFQYHHEFREYQWHAQYQNDYHMNGGFGSDLDDFIIDHPEIQVWTHGHTHDPFNYKIGNTRVICNPRGYTGYESRTRDFSPLEGFDI
jgi:hypothetical protein